MQMINSGLDSERKKQTKQQQQNWHRCRSDSYSFPKSIVFRDVFGEIVFDQIKLWK